MKTWPRCLTSGFCWAINSLPLTTALVISLDFPISRKVLNLWPGGKLNELMSLTEFSLSHSYQSKLSKTGSSLDFPSLLFPAHAQYTLCTCSVKGFPSLLCLHILSPSTQMHNFQAESSPAANTCIIYRTTVVLQQKTAHPPWKTAHPPICEGKYHWYDSK